MIDTSGNYAFIMFLKFLLKDSRYGNMKCRNSVAHSFCVGKASPKEPFEIEEIDMHANIISDEDLFSVYDHSPLKWLNYWS